MIWSWVHSFSYLADSAFKTEDDRNHVAKVTTTTAELPEVSLFDLSSAWLGNENRRSQQGPLVRMRQQNGKKDSPGAARMQLPGDRFPLILSQERELRYIYPASVHHWSTGSSWYSPALAPNTQLWAMRESAQAKTSGVSEMVTDDAQFSVDPQRSHSCPGCHSAP